MGFLDFLGLGSDGSGLGSFITDSLFGGVTAGLDSLGWTQHGRDQYFNREMQREFLDKQQNFQREQTKNQQDFTEMMYQKQWGDMLSRYPLLAQRLNDQQFNMWRNQFNMQNEWNEQMYNKYQSPQAVVNANSVAGLNPAGLNGVNNGVSANTMGSSSASQPPQISPTPFSSPASPVGIPQGLSGKGTTIKEIGSFLRDISEAKKKGVETDQLEKLFSYEVEERAQRIFGQRLTNDSIALANYVANNTKDIKVRLAAQELVKLVSDTENVEQDTQLKFEKMWNERSQYLLNIAKKRLSEKDYEILEFKVNNLQTEFDTTMANIRADTAKKTSETRLNNALRETENQLRDGKVTCQELGNSLSRIGVEIAYNDLWVSNRNLDSKVTGLIHSFEREGIITKQEPAACAVADT